MTASFLKWSKKGGRKGGERPTTVDPIEMEEEKGLFYPQKWPISEATALT